MAAQDSYVFLILKYLGDLGQSRNAEQILDYLHTARFNRQNDDSFTLAVPRDLRSLESNLLSLEEIGVLRKHQNLNGPTSWSLSAMPVDGYGGNGGRRDERSGGEDPGGGGGGVGGAGGDTPGGEGGGGLSEVLGHPVLFCLSEEVQDQLLKEALGIQPVGSHEAGGRPA